MADLLIQAISEKALEAEALKESARWNLVHFAKGELRELFYDSGPFIEGSKKTLLAMNDKETLKGILQALDYLESATSKSLEGSTVEPASEGVKP